MLPCEREIFFSATFSCNRKYWKGERKRERGGEDASAHVSKQAANSPHAHTQAVGEDYKKKTPFLPPPSFSHLDAELVSDLLAPDDVDQTTGDLAKQKIDEESSCEKMKTPRSIESAKEKDGGKKKTPLSIHPPQPTNSSIRIIP